MINGGNEISGITFNGSGTAIYFEGRSNQKIHNCTFNHFVNAIDIHGKYPVWSDSYTSSRASETASYCDDDETLSVEPGTTDWATGVEIYNNQLIDSKIYPHTIKGVSIHDNLIDNSISLKSAVGNTSYWWNNVQFYNNTLKLKTIAWSTIALEVWMVEGDTKFSNNWTNGWFSILDNPHGSNTPYSWEIINNTFASDVPPGLGSDPAGTALETCYHTSNVFIAHNFFSNTGPNNTCNMLSTST